MDPEFGLTAGTAAATAELCVRLDGLPLAIELVAARAAQLGVAVTLDRLARRLPLPTSHMHDAPARQQSVRATLEWGLDLLDPLERDLFRQLGVFAGGWTVPAAEAVAGDGCRNFLTPLRRSRTSRWSSSIAAKGLRATFVSGCLRPPVRWRSTSSTRAEIQTTFAFAMRATSPCLPSPRRPATGSHAGSRCSSARARRGQHRTSASMGDLNSAP